MTDSRLRSVGGGMAHTIRVARKDREWGVGDRDQGTGTRERNKAAAAMAEAQVERCIFSSLRARSISTRS